MNIFIVENNREDHIKNIFIIMNIHRDQNKVIIMDTSIMKNIKECLNKATTIKTMTKAMATGMTEHQI